MKCPHIIPVSESFRREFCSNVAFKARLMTWMYERKMPGWVALQRGHLHGIGFVNIKDAVLFKLTWGGVNNDSEPPQAL